ncbi:MAG TPA: hypothetical protein VMQ62_05060 [Dongiaceae bacterium]|nr:hypothetical protein [Dongiaceae bacterium]
MNGRRPPAAARRALALLLPIAAAALSACGETKTPPPPAPPAKHFPAPLYDGLSLGMTRAEAARVHPIRVAVTSGGRNQRVWIYERRGEATVHLTFTGRAESDTLKRIDVHYGPTAMHADEFIDRFRPQFGDPEVLRRKAVVNSYGDRAHNQFETIWSDATQYVFLTERVPLPGRPGQPVYFLTVRGKTLSANGPPTGYVPPPALDEDGNPIEEPVF